MLDLLLIGFVGKKFYDLAKKYGKNPWVFAIIGVVTCLVSIFVVGIILGFILVFFELYWILELPDLALGLMCIPFALLIVWGLHVLLKNAWMKEKELSPVEKDVLDSGSFDEL